MDAIVNQIKRLASGADEAQRKAILVSLREVSDSIETPPETIQRLVYLVSSVISCPAQRIMGSSVELTTHSRHCHSQQFVLGLT
jgi:hypothetical protein